ncbi:MAG: hypothetical protein ACD_52C00094G0002 [uncultured bacterium]|nr:MAG: hypothetical protein ACD_52C00094G0002 [uncultured bacterium]
MKKRLDETVEFIRAFEKEESGGDGKESKKRNSS